jgi:hypothetical protein
VVVYLDLNHYINLAKDVKSGGGRVTARIRKLVDDGVAVFPVSIGHLMEISAIGRPDQRQDLADTIRSIANGYVLRPLDEVMYLEVLSRVATHYGKPQDFGPQSVLTKGFVKAAGKVKIDFSPWREIDLAKSAVAEAQFDKIISDDAILNEMVASYHPKIAAGSTEHLAIVAAVESDRKLNAGKSVETMRHECLQGLSKKFIGLVFRACADLGLSEPEMFASPPKHFWAPDYMATIPTINCWSKLNTLLYRNPSVDVKVNHLYDFAHLAVAIPYSGVVVTDAEMTHTITTNKVHSEYGTVVISQLDELFKLPELSGAVSEL